MAIATKSKARGLSRQEISDACRLIPLIGDPTRVRILEVLDDGRRNVGEICKLTGIVARDYSKVSHHLTLMRVAGLVDFEREGKQSSYFATQLGLDLLAVVRQVAAASLSWRRS